jgi:hypothetical protein
MGGDNDSTVIPVKGSAQNTDEIAIDDDDDEMEEVEKGPSGKQQMARMNLEEKAIPAAVSCLSPLLPVSWPFLCLSWPSFCLSASLSHCMHESDVVLHIWRTHTHIHTHAHA